VPSSSKSFIATGAFMRGPLIEPSRKRVAALRTPDNSVIGVKSECSEKTPTALSPHQNLGLAG
jgi:hypothetical protein